MSHYFGQTVPAFFGDRRHPFVEEPLQAAAVVGLGRVDVALRVGGDAVHGVELAGHLAAVAEAGEDLERLPIEDPDLLVLAVGEVDELLLRIVREGDVPGRAVAERALADPRFLDELAVRREHLDAVVDAVADVDQAVVRQLGAVHRRAELLRQRRVGVVASEVGVVRLVAVGAPVALELAGVGVDARRRACCRSRRRCRPRSSFLSTKILATMPKCSVSVAVDRHALLADLHQELAVLRELQHHAVAGAVAADPDVALVVDGDAVVRRRPLVAVAVGAAPVAEQVALLDRTRGSAAPSAARAGLGVCPPPRSR